MMTFFPTRYFFISKASFDFPELLTPPMATLITMIINKFLLDTYGKIIQSFFCGFMKIAFITEASPW